MPIEKKQTVLETLENIKRYRQDLKEIKDKLYMNNAEISSMLLLVNERTLQQFEYEINKNKSGSIKEPCFRIIFLGEPYKLESQSNFFKDFIIPINFSSFRFYHTNRGPMIFKCKVDLQVYPVYSVFLKGSLIFTTTKNEWLKFAEFFDIQMDLFTFFGISLTVIQEELLKKMTVK